MPDEKPTANQKALAINLDAHKYGTLAEIGAGQETARWFFRVGGASGTVAKTISAYDMTVSDAIYEPASQFIIHARMRDTENLREQEALGTIGAKRLHASMQTPCL